MSVETALAQMTENKDDDEVVVGLKRLVRHLLVDLDALELAEREAVLECMRDGYQIVDTVQEEDTFGVLDSLTMKVIFAGTEDEMNARWVSEKWFHYDAAVGKVDPFAFDTPWPGIPADLLADIREWVLSDDEQARAFVES